MSHENTGPFSRRSTPLHPQLFLDIHYQGPISLQAGPEKVMTAADTRGYPGLVLNLGTKGNIRQGTRAI
jgi:hypothetical protein